MGGLSSDGRNLVTLSFPAVPCYSETTDGCHEYPDPAFRGPRPVMCTFHFLRQSGATIQNKRAGVILRLVSGVGTSLRRRVRGLIRILQ